MSPGTCQAEDVAVGSGGGRNEAVGSDGGPDEAVGSGGGQRAARRIASRGRNREEVQVKVGIRVRVRVRFRSTLELGRTLGGPLITAEWVSVATSSMAYVYSAVKSKLGRDRLRSRTTSTGQAW